MRKSILLVCLLLFGCSQASKTISLPDFEHRIWELTNQERMAANLPPLLYDEGLADLARQHSQNMYKYHFFAHKDQNGYLVDTRKKQYYSSLIVVSIGENLAKIENNAKVFTPEEIVEGWMNSPEHRDNILNSTFTYLGVGVVSQGSLLLATQNFATPIVKLLSDIPADCNPQYQYQLKFAYLANEPKTDLQAVLNFPDAEFKYNIDDKYYTMGLKPVPIQWTGTDQFEVLVDFPAGKGNYSLCFGFGHSYFEDGIKLKVK